MERRWACKVQRLAIEQRLHHDASAELVRALQGPKVAAARLCRTLKARLVAMPPCRSSPRLGSLYGMHCPLFLAEVAEKVAFTSTGNLSRLFRQHHGVSFQANLQKLGLEKAAGLLKTTQLPVSRVARRVGYKDVSRFGQHFQRHHGRTPGAWRKR